MNALQRHASVVVQKSIAEGFGLTVAEAMWKSRPIVASAAGGIRDQIVDGQHGLLIEDPRDLAAFGAAVEGLLSHPQDAAILGANAHTRAAEEFIGDRHLEQYGRLFEGVQPDPRYRTSPDMTTPSLGAATSGAPSSSSPRRPRT